MKLKPFLLGKQLSYNTLLCFTLITVNTALKTTIIVSVLFLPLIKLIVSVFRRIGNRQVFLVADSKSSVILYIYLKKKLYSQLRGFLVLSLHSNKQRKGGEILFSISGHPTSPCLWWIVCWWKYHWKMMPLTMRRFDILGEMCHPL